MFATIFISVLVKLQDYNSVLPSIVLALALGAGLECQRDNELVVVSGSLGHVHAGRHSI
jgi:hypothetical protein